MVKFNKELEVARSMAMHAGDLALGYLGKVGAELKPDLSPVTVADRECERLMASRIEEIFPEDGILGEEGSRKASRSGRTWILDPIDGTRDFVRGLPLWSQLIGLEADGEVVVGVCNMAARREMYYAVKDGGAWLGEQRLEASKVSRASGALVCVNGLASIADHPISSSLLAWLKQFDSVRSFGGCYDAMLVAAGRAEIWIESQAAPWDLAALTVILREAGADYINFDGGASIYGGNCAAFVRPLEPVVRELVVR